MRLVVGKAYYTRMGDVVTIVEEDINAFICPFVGSNDLSYEPNGSFYPGREWPNDLVREVEETPAQDSTAELVLDEVYEERARQDGKWGQQNHSAPDWYVILGEEVGEVARAIYEKDYANYREELIQVAAVAVAMVEAFDRAHPLGYP